MNSVLIIDDDKELCALMKKCVEQENLSAVVAHGGLEGLRLLKENKDTWVSQKSRNFITENGRHWRRADAAFT